MRILRINLNLVLSAILFAAVITYIMALYFTFVLSPQIESGILRLSRLKEEIVAKELGLRGAEAELFKGKRKFLDSMVEVGAIKYLVPESVAASRFVPNQ